MKIATQISNTIKSIINKKAKVKALHCAMIDADQKLLKVTDLDIMGIVSGVPVTGGGKILVNGYALQRIMAATKKTLVMEITDNKLHVTSDGDTYTLDSGASVDNFPEMATDLEITTSIKDVPLILFNTRVCASTEETRYYLNGVFLETENSILRAVATDGHRLAIREKPVTLEYGSLTMETSTILPTKSVTSLQTIYTSNISMAFAGNKVIVTGGNVTVISKLIDGKFPDYRRVIPANHDLTIDVDGKELARVLSKKAIVDVKSASMFGGNTGYWVRLDGSTAMLEKKLSETPSKVFKIGFNASYMQDIIADMANKSFKAHISESQNPIKIESSDEGSMYVLMPMRV